MSCGGTVGTRSTPSGVATDAGETGGTNGTGGHPQAASGGSRVAGSPGIAGYPVEAGGAVGSCNPAFCAPEGSAPGCCVSPIGPCGVDYGDGCAARCPGVCPGGPGPPPPYCMDGIKDGPETDTDCGGQWCLPCAAGKACVVDADCIDYRCIKGICNLPEPIVDASPPPGCDGSACTPTNDAGPIHPPPKPIPSCSDGIKNGSETDVDCGGNCRACRVGDRCVFHYDCITRNCLKSQICGTAECIDGMQNGVETDVDCGGGICLSCTTGKHCTYYLDCASFVCAGAMCMAPTCTDGVRNGDEVCVDCGGSCPVCNNCPSD
jgi:hypothetical protein